MGSVSVPRVVSRVENLEFITHQHSLYTLPTDFQFQVDLQINLTVTHVPCGRQAETSESRCFDMSLCFDPDAEALFSDILGLVGTPPVHRPYIAGCIVRHGRHVAESFRHADHGWAHIILNIDIDHICFRVLALERAMVERALAASARDAGHGMVPASKEAVRRSLKRVRVETHGDPKKKKRSKTTTKTCSICLEDIETCGTSMPCSHVFHEGCIVKWLRQSHYCPLCRFQIPTESTRIATDSY